MGVMIWFGIAVLQYLFARKAIRLNKLRMDLQAYHEEMCRQPGLAEQVVAEPNKSMVNISRIKKDEEKRAEKAYKEELKAAIRYAAGQRIKAWVTSPTSEDLMDTQKSYRNECGLQEVAPETTTPIPRTRDMTEIEYWESKFIEYTTGQSQSTNNNTALDIPVRHEPSNVTQSTSTLHKPYIPEETGRHVGKGRKNAKGPLRVRFAPIHENQPSKSSIPTKKTKGKSRLKSMFKKKKKEPRVERDWPWFFPSNAPSYSVDVPGESWGPF